MNTTQLTESIAKTHKLPKAQAKRIVTSVFDSIQTQVTKGKPVSIAGFGTFTRAKRKARVGRNPKTGESIKIAARKFPKFKPGTAFKTAVK